MVQMGKSVVVAGLVLFGATSLLGEEGSEPLEKRVHALGAEENVIDDATKIKLFDEYKAKVDNEVNEAQRSFAGLNWGVGLAFTSIAGKSIEKADVVDGKVRILEEHGKFASLMLESHYFFRPNKSFMGTDIGFGPFAAVQLADEGGTDIDTYGIGIMMGFKNQDVTDGGSWNLGFGYFVDTNVQEFGSGVQEGQPRLLFVSKRLTKADFVSCCHLRSICEYTSQKGC